MCISAIIGGIALYMGHKKQKQRKQTLAQIQEEEKRNGGNNRDPEESKDDSNRYPHGIYKSASYHHDNSKGCKSPGAVDGQRCLDYSVPNFDKKIQNGVKDLFKQLGCVRLEGKIVKQIIEMSPI
jgi:hypothetical protein